VNCSLCAFEDRYLDFLDLLLLFHWNFPPLSILSHTFHASITLKFIGRFERIWLIHGSLPFLELCTKKCNVFVTYSRFCTHAVRGIEVHNFFPSDCGGNVKNKNVKHMKQINVMDSFVMAVKVGTN
jgi:hypothetical protein